MKAMKQSMAKPINKNVAKPYAKGGAVKAKPKKYADGGIVAQMPIGPATQMPTPRMPRTPRVEQNPGMPMPMLISQPKPAVMPPMISNPVGNNMETMPRVPVRRRPRVEQNPGMPISQPKPTMSTLSASGIPMPTPLTGTPMPMMKKGGMVKGYAKGGMVNCGASVPASQKSKK